MHENVMSADETGMGVSLLCSSRVQIAELLKKAECNKAGQVRSKICSSELNCLQIMHEIFRSADSVKVKSKWASACLTAAVCQL